MKTLRGTVRRLVREAIGVSSPTARPIHVQEQQVSFESLIAKLDSALGDTEILVSEFRDIPELAEVYRLIEEATAAAKRGSSEPEEDTGKQSVAAPWVRGKLGHRGV